MFAWVMNISQSINDIIVKLIYFLWWFSVAHVKGIQLSIDFRNKKPNTIHHEFI